MCRDWDWISTPMPRPAVAPVELMNNDEQPYRVYIVIITPDHPLNYTVSNLAQPTKMQSSP